jgi:PadR family transcriptional regulator, regulatory protein PadR
MPESGAFDEELGRAIDKWRGQSRKGFLELCLLACVREALKTYGFAMLESLRRSGLELSEGTLYPLLTRLVREGMLASNWDMPEEGHPRKYYTLTLMGLSFLDEVLKERRKDEEALNAILAGRRENREDNRD